MPSLLPSSSFQSPISGTDSISTLYQILSLLSLHYLTLSIFIPPFLSTISSTSPSALTYDTPLNFEGGAIQIGMILDWREISSRTTFDWSPLGEDFLTWRKGLSKEELLKGLDQGDREVAKEWKMGSVWLGETDAEAEVDTIPSSSSSSSSSSPVLIDVSHVIRQGSRSLHALRPDSEEIKSELGTTGGSKAETDLQQWEWKATRDPWRGWAIAIAWGLACVVDVFLLTTIIRRPKHILDHVFTLHLLNLLLTSWYTSSIPTSLFWWTLMLLHGLGSVLWSERLAIGREMRTTVGIGLVGSAGASTSASASVGGQGMDVELGQGQRGGGAGGLTQAEEGRGHHHPHVLFDEDEGEDNDDEEEEEEEEQGETSKMIKKPAMTSSLGISRTGRSNGGGGGGGGGGVGGMEDVGEEIEMASFLRSTSPPPPSSSLSSLRG